MASVAPASPRVCAPRPRARDGRAGLDLLEAALAGVPQLDRLSDAVGIPTLVELGFTKDEIPMLARIAFEDPQTIGNPRELGIADYEEIYRAALRAASEAGRPRLAAAGPSAARPPGCAPA